MAVAIFTGSRACATPVFKQHAVGAQLHGDGDVAGGADAGVHDHRVARVIVLERLQAQRDVERIEHALSRSDRAAGGHHAGRAGVLEPTRA